MKLIPLTCGSILLEDSFLTPGHGTGLSERAAVAMFLVEHPRGLVLIDTGNHPDVARNAAAYWGRDTAEWIKPEMRPEDSVDRQIARLGYSASAITDVVLTHLHLDHAGGMCLFPHAKFHIQRDELVAAMWPDPRFDEGWYEFKDFAASRRFDINALDGDSDVFGDGAIQLIKTGGHAAGHQMVLLELPQTGRVLLPGDAAFTPRQLDLMCPPGDPLPQPEAALDAVRRVAAMREDGVRIVYSHPSMEDWKNTYRAILE